MRRSRVGRKTSSRSPVRAAVRAAMRACCCACVSFCGHVTVHVAVNVAVHVGVHVVVHGTWSNMPLDLVELASRGSSLELVCVDMFEDMRA